MTTDINQQAANSLLVRAANCAGNDLATAELLIRAAKRLDNTIDIDECMELAQNTWMTKQYSERSVS